MAKAPVAARRGRPPKSAGSTAVAKRGRPTGARVARAALVPRTVAYHEFEVAPDPLTVDYLRQLIRGIPNKVPGEHVVIFEDGRTIVSADGRTSGKPVTAHAAEVEDDDDDDDLDEDDE